MIDVTFLEKEINDAVFAASGLHIARHIENVFGIDVSAFDLLNLDNVQVGGALKVRQ